MLIYVIMNIYDTICVNMFDLTWGTVMMMVEGFI